MSVVSAKKQIRGSGLLLAGRLLSLFLNLLTQVLIIRYLSKLDYGVFAYTLALVSTVTSLNRLGMERTASRFVPIYEEEGDLPSAAGAVVLALGTMLAIGFAIVALVIGFQGLLGARLMDDPAVVSVLVVLIALAPINALDSLLQALFSAFGRPRIIFLRKYVIGPCLKLAAIALTIALSGDVHTLAIAYLAAGVVGLALYGGLLPSVLREHGLLDYFHPRKLSIRYRRLFRYSMPVFTADMTDALRAVLVVVLVEFFHNLSEVADFRAVLPMARLNHAVLVSFSLLFLPMASRLFAQKNAELLADMQSHMALWVTVLSFPIFATCVSLAEPLIVLLIGERYAASAPILVILALGYFFQAALGLNRQTLRALGKVRVLLYIEFIATAAILLLALLLIPTLGAIGGAIATTATMILYSCMNTAMLWRITGNNPVPWEHARVFLMAAACALGLWLLRPLTGTDSIAVLLLFTALSVLLLLLFCWKLLRFSEIFPEAHQLLRSMKRFLGFAS